MSTQTFTKSDAESKYKCRSLLLVQWSTTKWTKAGILGSRILDIFIKESRKLLSNKMNIADLKIYNLILTLLSRILNIVDLMHLSSKYVPKFMRRKLDP